MPAGTYWDDVEGRYVKPTDPEWSHEKLVAVLFDGTTKGPLFQRYSERVEAAKKRAGLSTKPEVIERPER